MVRNPEKIRLLGRTGLKFEEDFDTLKRKMLEQMPALTGESPVHLVVSDLDEVLVRISVKWAARLFSAGRLDRPYGPEELYGREEYNLAEFLGLGGGEALAAYDCPGFYDDLAPTRLGEILSLLSEKGRIKLAIVSHTTGGNTGSKREFCSRFFPSADRFFLPLSRRKSDVIVSKGLGGYSTFIDDSVAVMCDVAARTGIAGKEFLMPRYGYNVERLLPRPLLTALAESGASLRYYEPEGLEGVASEEQDIEETSPEPWYPERI